MSRQGLPVRTTHNTASTKRRLFSPLRPGSPGLPRQCASICAHWASVSTSRSIVSLNHTLTRANNPDSQQALVVGVALSVWCLRLPEARAAEVQPLPTDIKRLGEAEG